MIVLLEFVLHVILLRCMSCCHMMQRIKDRCRNRRDIDCQKRVRPHMGMPGLCEERGSLHRKGLKRRGTLRRSYAHRNTGAFVARQECDHAVCTLQTLHKRCKLVIVKLGSLTGDTAFSIFTQFPLNLFTSPGSISELRSSFFLATLRDKFAHNFVLPAVNM